MLSVGDVPALFLSKTYFQDTKWTPDSLNPTSPIRHKMNRSAQIHASTWPTSLHVNTGNVKDTLRVGDPRSAANFRTNVQGKGGRGHDL